MGFVQNAAAFLRSVQVVAIPTLSGGGVQIKTLDALGAAAAIVATPAAVRGLEGVPEALRIASTPEAFAAQIITTLGADAATREGWRLACGAWSKDRAAIFSGQVRQAVAALARLR